MNLFQLVSPTRQRVEPNVLNAIAGVDDYLEEQEHQQRTIRTRRSPQDPVEHLYGRKWAAIPLVYEVKHAPPGGVTIQGKRFIGGQFIPAEVLAQASPQERAAVEGGGQAGGGPPHPPGGAKPAEPPQQQPKSAPPPPMPPGDPIEMTRGLSPADAELEMVSQMFVRQNFPQLRDMYLAKNASVDAATGEVKSIMMNTDDWRSLVPGYTGVNANAVHEASSWCNKQMMKEAIPNMRGKGNNTFMVYAGGGGSGKGTATREFFNSTEFPIILDQVSDREDKLMSRLVQAAKEGYKPKYVFIDRPPEDAVGGGVVGRAISMYKDFISGKSTEPPRTVPVDMALKANIDSRVTSLHMLRNHPEIDVSIIDNRGGRFKRRLIEDRNEAIQYTMERIMEDQASMDGGVAERIKENILARHQTGEIPEHIVTGLLGEGWKPHPDPLVSKLADMKVEMMDRMERMQGQSLM